MESRNHPIGPGRDRRKAASGLALDGAAPLVRELLDLVRLRTGFGLVMVTRAIGEEWRIVEVTDNPYGVAAGDVLRWSDSICSRMVGGADPGPWVLPRVDGVDAVADAPVRGRLDIASYAGAALLGGEGAVLGTLCAIDPQPRSEQQDRELLVFAQSFATWALRLAAETGSATRAAERRLLRASPSGPLDAPRASWPALLEAELARARWTGETPVLVLLRSVSGGRPWPAGRLAEVVRRQLAADDAVAVLGSNRVGVLRPSGGLASADALVEAVRADVATHEVTIASAAAELVGPGSAAEVADALEATLVGEAAAAARQASTSLTYDFCDACGRKGRYALADARHRCKYCGLVDP